MRGMQTIRQPAFPLVVVVARGGVEPPTFRFSAVRKPVQPGAAVPIVAGQRDSRHTGKRPDGPELRRKLRRVAPRLPRVDSPPLPDALLLLRAPSDGSAVPRPVLDATPGSSPPPPTKWPRLPPGSRTPAAGARPVDPCSVIKGALRAPPARGPAQSSPS